METDYLKMSQITNLRTQIEQASGSAGSADATSQNANMNTKELRYFHNPVHPQTQTRNPARPLGQSQHARSTSNVHVNARGLAPPKVGSFRRKSSERERLAQTQLIPNKKEMESTQISKQVVPPLWPVNKDNYMKEKQAVSVEGNEDY